MNLGSSFIRNINTYIRNILYIILLIIVTNIDVYGQPLSAQVDPSCTVKCCTSTQPCSCSAGVIASGGIPPYIYSVFGSSGIVGTTACVTGLCPGNYLFVIRDAANNQISIQVPLTLNFR
jgi:hypothetical protein